MRFVFKAKDKEGTVKEGVVDALTQDMAVQILQRSGLALVSLQKEETGGELEKSFRKVWERITDRELVVFFRQLSILVESKVPLVNSLSALEAQAENKYFRIILKEIIGNINDGMVFSETLEKYPDTFSPLVVNIVKAGEISGNLQKSILYAANNIEKSYQLNSKIKSALIYPAFVFGVAGLIGFVVVSFILPQLSSLIRDMHVETPWYTQVVMGLGDFMAVYWWAVLLFVMMIFGSSWYYVHTVSGKKSWEHFQLNVPIFGTLFRYAYLARFADTFGSLLGSGIPLVKALSITADVVGNEVFRNVFMLAAEEVKAGGAMSKVLEASADIPPVVTQMVRIGEETGKLNEVLEGTAKFYEQETDTITKNLTVLLEPVLIVALGIGVAILVFSIILPIYNIAGQI